jgi:hypothetical protein
MHGISKKNVSEQQTCMEYLKRMYQKTTNLHVISKKNVSEQQTCIEFLKRMYQNNKPAWNI